MLILPACLEHALQGVVFWTGHRRALYRDYPLAEGAFVAEICNLVFANLPAGMRLACEVPYKELAPAGSWGATRADLVLYRMGPPPTPLPKRQRRLPAGAIPEYVLEVKRAKAPPAEINKDLGRLSDLSGATRLPCLLIVVSEGHRPDRFVSNTGIARRVRGVVPSRVGKHYAVRRVLKAGASFTHLDEAHYACLIELL